MTQADERKRATRGPSPQKTSRTRERIIEVGLKQFIRTGYSATTMDQIAAECGFGKGTLYRYFRNKEELLLQIVSERVVGIFKEALSIPREAGESMKAYCLRTLLPIMGTTEESGRADLARLVLREVQTFPVLHALYHSEVYLPLQAHLRRIVELAQADGEIDPAQEAEMLAHLLVSPLWFAIVHNGMLAQDKTVDSAVLFAAQINAVFCSTTATR